MTGALNFHEIRDFRILVMVFRYMNLTLKGIVKIYPCLITKRHYILSFKKNITGDFFQTLEFNVVL